MMKRFAMFLSAFLLAVSCAGCNSENAGSSSDTIETEPITAESVKKEENAETETETETEEIQTEDLGIQEIEMNEEFLAKVLTMTEEPDNAIETDVTEADFVGIWECVAISKDEICYSSMFDIPLYATEHLEINADHTGSIISVKAGEKPETSELPFTWNLLGSSLNIEVKLNDEITTSAAIHMTEERKLMIQSSDEEGNEVNAYYRYVDSYTYFDFVSADFNYNSLFK